MNSVNIALDIFCIFISILICFYVTSCSLSNYENRNFFFISFSNIIFTLGDLTDWCCNGLAKPWYPIALHIGQFIYYLVIIPLMNSFLRYIYYYLSTYKKLSSWYLKTAAIISFFHMIGSILTPLTRWYYYISDDNIYYRGNFVVASSILPIFSYIMVLCMTIEVWKLLNYRTRIALLSYICFPIIGHIIQFLFRGVGTIIPALTLSMLFIFINIQLDIEIELEKEKQALQEAKISIWLSQIQPHFLYNTLTVIRYLCDTDPIIAKECINDFSIFLRGNMDSLSSTKPIPFEQELKHVNSYLKLEQQRFGHTLTFEYDLQTINFLVPALSLQPLVENAIRHGLRKKETDGNICISTTENDLFYYLIVEDNGIGFDTATIFDKKHIGIRNVKKRLQLLCNGELKFESIPNKGTKATIIIPKEKGGL